MSGEAVAKIAKPQLRGLLQKSIKTNLAVGIVLSIVGALAYKIVIMDPRKKVYAEFYKKYDAEESFERMRKAGLLNSASP